MGLARARPVLGRRCRAAHAHGPPVEGCKVGQLRSAGDPQALVKPRAPIRGTTDSNPSFAPMRPAGVKATPSAVRSDRLQCHGVRGIPMKVYGRNSAFTLIELLVVV